MHLCSHFIPVCGPDTKQMRHSDWHPRWRIHVCWYTKPASFAWHPPPPHFLITIFQGIDILLWSLFFSPPFLSFVQPLPIHVTSKHLCDGNGKMSVPRGVNQSYCSARMKSWEKTWKGTDWLWREKNKTKRESLLLSGESLFPLWYKEWFILTASSMKFILSKYRVFVVRSMRRRKRECGEIKRKMRNEKMLMTPIVWKSPLIVAVSKPLAEGLVG